MTVDLYLLQEAIHFAETSTTPEDALPGDFYWDQNYWYLAPDNDINTGTCGTGVCIAGWISIVHEHKKPVVFGDGRAYDIELPEGSVTVKAHARIVLGLNVHDASRLFHYDNTLDDLKRHYNRMAQGLPLQYRWEMELEDVEEDDR